MLSLQPLIQPANLLRRIGVVLGSVLVTAFYCVQVIVDRKSVV